jgi:hypothetical protein
MRDPAAETGAGGIGVVKMDGVVVAAGSGKGADDLIGDGEHALAMATNLDRHAGKRTRKSHRQAPRTTATLGILHGVLARALLIIAGVVIGVATVVLTRPGDAAKPGGVVTLTGPGLTEAYITLYQPAPAAYGVFVPAGSGWVRIDSIAPGATGTLTPRVIGAASMLRVAVAPTQRGLVATNLDGVRRAGSAVGVLLDRVQLLAPSCDPRLLTLTRRALPYLTRLANPAARSAAQALRRLVRAVATGRCQAVGGALAPLAEAAATLAQAPLITG